MKVSGLVLLAALTLSGAASAAKTPVPQSGHPRAILISSGEIAAAVKHSGTGALSDSVLRVVPIVYTIVRIDPRGVLARGKPH